MILSVFTDELFMDAKLALPAIAGWGCRYVDFRGMVNGKGIEYQTDEELAALKAQLDALGLKVAAIQSSLCKTHLPDEAGQQKEMEKLEGLIRACDALDCRLVRIFNYWQPEREPEKMGQLAVRPDEMNRVLAMFSPIAKRAKEAGLICAFENCGQNWREVIAFVKALGIPEWGLAWDVHNNMDMVKDDEALTQAYFLESLEWARMVHVKAASILPELPGVKVPWARVLRGVKAAGDMPVSIETHNPQGSPYTNEEATRLSFLATQNLIPASAPGAVEEAIREIPAFARPYKDDPVRFAVVGLGMGSFRARQLRETEGCKLCGVCDINPEKAKKYGEEFGVPYSTDIGVFLNDPDIEVMYVVVPTGRHVEIAEKCLRAGKHVLTTKPLDVTAENCRRLIRAAKETGRLAGVDFDMRMDPMALSLKKAVDEGWFGHMLSAEISLYVDRSQAYYDENGAWRGTWRLDGGGAMCNQGVHEVDLLQTLLGMPLRVRARTETQAHMIETEDIGFAEWDYGNRLIARFYSTTNYPLPAWYTRVALHGTAGAFVHESGGPGGAKTFYGKNGAWSEKPPFPAARAWRQGSDAFAAAVRGQAPVLVPPEEGIKSRLILDAMYESARNGGAWTDVEKQ